MCVLDDVGDPGAEAEAEARHPLHGDKFICPPTCAEQYEVSPSRKMLERNQFRERESREREKKQREKQRERQEQ